MLFIVIHDSQTSSGKMLLLEYKPIDVTVLPITLKLGQKTFIFPPKRFSLVPIHPSVCFSNLAT